jgi:hypothetical protein
MTYKFPRTPEEYTAWSLCVQGRWIEHERELLEKCNTLENHLLMRKQLHQFISRTHCLFPDLIVLELLDPHIPDFEVYTIVIAGVDLGIMEHTHFLEIIKEHA